MLESARDFVLRYSEFLLDDDEEEDVPEEIAALRAELIEERRRYGVQPYTPERAAKIRAAWPPPSGEKWDAYMEALRRDR